MNTINSLSQAIISFAHHHGVTKNTIISIFEKAINSYTLACIGMGTAIQVSGVLAPMALPFIFTDKRTPDAYKKAGELEKGAFLEKLESEVNLHAKKFHMDQIHVRFGISTGVYGFNKSIGGPLLSVNEREAKEWLTKGKLNDLGKAIIYHELTHLYENHLLWKLPMQITALAISVVALTYFFPFFLKVKLAVGTLPFIFKVAALITLYVTVKIISPKKVLQSLTYPVDRYFERKADRGAIAYQDKKEALNTAKAAKKYFEDLAKKDLKTRNEGVESHLFYSLYTRLNYNSKGEKRFSSHPSPLERMTFFEAEEKRLLI